jgi:hypothetical protein
MDQQKQDIAIIGECLIELTSNGSLSESSTLNKYFGVIRKSLEKDDTNLMKEISIEKK